MNKVPVLTLSPLTLLVKYGLVDREDGTIFDTRTNLLWQQSSSDKYYTWKDAHTYCGKLRLAGYTDWRLPTIEELKTLIEMEYKPIICPIFKCESYWYWSSSTSVDILDYAWYVSFHGDYVGSGISGKDGHFYVRAVRGV